MWLGGEGGRGLVHYIFFRPFFFVRLWKIEKVLVKGSLAGERRVGSGSFLILRDLQEILTSFLEYM